MQIFVRTQKASPATHANPVVLIHGSRGSSAMWMGFLEYFSQKGWDAYALDLRGHGQSEGEVAGATMEDYAADVHQAITEHGLVSPIIIGHSMGGLVALMYAAKHGASALVSIDPSPTKEVQGAGEKKEYPEVYFPLDAGMPAEPMEVMKALPDVPQEMLMKLKEMLGTESGVARSERKLGISVPKEALSMPTLFVGGEFGESVPFGIGFKSAKAMAGYYGTEALEIKGATHPGILIGEHAMEAAKQIEAWLARHIAP